MREWRARVASDSVTYGKLPPLNPDDLKLPPPPPSAADKVTRTGDAISIGEVWEEIKAKVKEMYVAHDAGTWAATAHRLRLAG